MHLRSVLRVLVPTFLFVVLTACATSTNIDKNAVFNADSPDAVVIMGVSPAYHITVSKGSATRLSFNYSTLFPPAFVIQPENGYIVARVSATSQDQAFAITHIRTDSSGGPTFKSCDGRQAVTFEAKPGEVLYLGNFHYLTSQERLRYSRFQRLERAQEHLRTYYPNIVPEAKSAQLEYREVIGLSCVEKIYIPITIYR
mgnify:CR=1 FL=1